MISPRIAVDFDNTIVDHRETFHAAAVAAELLPPGTARTKQEVRDALRGAGREDDWTRLQGLVYGPAMQDAPPHDGVTDFFARCRRAGIDVAIISHRTLHPFLGEPHDLHAAARSWLLANGFHAPPISLSDADIHFELTVEAKIARIATWGATVHVDDLPEFLGRDDWPEGVDRVLFDPHRRERSAPFATVHSWAEAAATLLP